MSDDLPPTAGGELAAPHDELAARTAIVNSGEIAAQRGVLDASYWTGRRDGESWDQWRVRREIEHLEGVAQWHQDQAAERLAEASKLREGTA